jgi:tetratricopeptide (TPR) repeat protein
MTATFTLVSLGSRGVGKTVFLACNCAEVLRSSQRKNGTEDMWFECADPEFQQKIENLVGYVVRTGQYPPPTFKIADFGFSLKSKGIGGVKTACNFRWLDLPGEWCDIGNAEFQSILLQSHGCCIFIDAYALLHEESYLASTEVIVNQVEAIASLVNQHNLKYPFVVICTKCDLVDLSPVGLIKLEEKLIPLLQRLDLVKAHYQRFYSAIPILNQANGGLLKVKNATAPLMWIMTELQKLHGAGNHLDLGTSLNQMLSDKPGHPKAKPARSNTWPLSWPLSLAKLKQYFSTPRTILFSALGIVILGSILALLLTFNRQQSANETLTPQQRLEKYDPLLSQDPLNREAITQVVDAHTEMGQYDEAIAKMEKSLQTGPRDMNVLFELAGLYALTNQEAKEEGIYDRILEQQDNNIFALTSKARLRQKKGDLKAADALFKRAEESAPTDSLKDTIKNISKDKPSS